MAIIKCPECGHNVSDKAKSCPSCGYVLEIDPIEKDAKNVNEHRSSSDLMVGIIVLVATIGLVLATIIPMLSK